MERERDRERERHRVMERQSESSMTSFGAPEVELKVRERQQRERERPREREILEKRANERALKKRQQPRGRPGSYPRGAPPTDTTWMGKPLRPRPLWLPAHWPTTVPAISSLPPEEATACSPGETITFQNKSSFKSVPIIRWRHSGTSRRGNHDACESFTYAHSHS